MPRKPGLPKPDTWRRQVQLSMSLAVLCQLEELAQMDANRARELAGPVPRFKIKPNMSGTVCDLIRAEYRRRKEAERGEPVKSRNGAAPS